MLDWRDDAARGVEDAGERTRELSNWHDSQELVAGDGLEKHWGSGTVLDSRECRKA